MFYPKIFCNVSTLVITEFEASKKCKVSVVVNYMTVCIVLHCPVHSFLAYSCADQESFVTGVPMFFGFVLIFWRADDVVIIKRGVRGPDHLCPPSGSAQTTISLHVYVCIFQLVI